jgi:hypothetical protein
MMYLGQDLCSQSLQQFQNAANNPFGFSYLLPAADFVYAPLRPSSIVRYATMVSMMVLMMLMMMMQSPWRQSWDGKSMIPCPFPVSLVFPGPALEYCYQQFRRARRPLHHSHSLQKQKV